MNVILNVYKKTLFPVYFSHCVMVPLFVKPQEPPESWPYPVSYIPNPILHFLTLHYYLTICFYANLNSPFPNLILSFHILLLLILTILLFLIFASVSWHYPQFLNILDAISNPHCKMYFVNNSFTIVSVEVNISIYWFFADWRIHITLIG